jgi:hypothetical protein
MALLGRRSKNPDRRFLDDRIFNYAYFSQSRFTGGQHNPATLNFDVERITSPKAKFAPDWTRKNDLTFP